MANRLRKVYLMHQVKEDRVIPVSEIAEVTGISSQTISSWIDDDTLPRCRPHKRIVKELCKYFRVERSELLGEDTHETA